MSRTSRAASGASSTSRACCIGRRCPVWPSAILGWSVTPSMASLLSVAALLRFERVFVARTASPCSLIRLPTSLCGRCTVGAVINTAHRLMNLELKVPAPGCCWPRCSLPVSFRVSWHVGRDSRVALSVPAVVIAVPRVYPCTGPLTPPRQSSRSTMRSGALFTVMFTIVAIGMGLCAFPYADKNWLVSKNEFPTFGVRRRTHEIRHRGESVKPPSFELSMNRCGEFVPWAQYCDRVRRGIDFARGARRTDFTLTLIHRRGRGWYFRSRPRHVLQYRKVCRVMPRR